MSQDHLASDRSSLDHDVVVVGAGPAGSVAASYLAKHGHSVLVIESERFPRFHVGESLLPLGNYVFDEIGCADKIAARGFQPKHGGQLRSGCGTYHVVFDFKTNRIEPSTTVQVHRAEFDKLLLDHAESLGAEVVVARARSYEIDEAGVSVAFASGGEPARTVRSRVIIDASGRGGFVAKGEGVRIPDTELQKAAVFAHFRSVPRDEGIRADDTRIVSLPNSGWSWWIPLSEDLTSVGVVLDIDEYRKKDKGDLDAIFTEAVQSTSLPAELLRDAERVTEFRVESGFSYGTQSYVGDRWFLAGDAGSFLDPVWSSGVQLALQSGLESAQAAIVGYLQPAPRREWAAKHYERKLRRRYEFVRRFVIAFYDPAARDLFFEPRPYFGLRRAITRVLAGGFDLNWLDKLRMKMFFLLGRLQRRFELVPRQVNSSLPNAATDADTSKVQQP
ncbi:MAG: flavin-dependent dehydrogenase [Planctomycetota bacterium]